MPPFSDDHAQLAGGYGIDRAELNAHRRRCAKTSKLLFALGLVTVAALCVVGLKPASAAIPLFFAASAAIFGSASAALFARIATFQLLESEPEEDDDGRGPGRGPDDPPDPPGGGEPEVDWERFEREFRAYCGRLPVAA